MKIKTLTCLLGFGLLYGTALAQVSLKGEIAGLKSDSLSFFYALDGKSKQITVPVKDGKFTWADELKSPVRMRVMVPVDSVLLGYTFYAEPGMLTMNGSAADRATVQKIKVTGSKNQDLYAEYSKLKETAYSEYLASGKKIQQATGGNKAALEKEMAVYHDQFFSGIDEDFITKYPDAYVSMDLLSRIISSGTYEQMSKLYNQISPSLKQSPVAKTMASKLELLKRSGIGQQMIDFTLNDYQGKSVSLADFKGKYVLVDFWASWCKPCRAENPNVLKAYNKYKDNNFTVVGISCDDSVEKWTQAIKEDGMPWTHVRDRKDRKSAIMDYYGIAAIPSTFLVDPSGKIIASNLRGAALDKKLVQLFAVKSK